MIVVNIYVIIVKNMYIILYYSINLVKIQQMYNIKLFQIKKYDKIVEELYEIKVNKENPLNEFKELKEVLKNEDDLLQYNIFAKETYNILKRIISNIYSINDLEVINNYITDIKEINDIEIKLKKDLKEIITEKLKQIIEKKEKLTYIKCSKCQNFLNEYENGYLFKFVYCEKCKSPFHYKCLGFKSIPEYEYKYICDICKNNINYEVKPIV